MKKCLLTILLLIMFFSIAVSIQAQQTTIVRYPDLSNAPEITGGLPHYIKYVFVFSLGIVGVVALLAIIIAGFNYITSVGNPQKAADAKDRIISALLGMILLLGSYVLLKTINPDLLKFKTETAQRVDIQTPSSPHEEGPEGCWLKGAAWNKPIIDVGQRATITLVLTKDCREHALTIIQRYGDINKFFERAPFFSSNEASLKQRNPGMGGDPDCYRYYEPDKTTSTLIEDETNKDDDPIVKWVYLFIGRCLVRGITFNCPLWGGGICNFAKNEPEKFYMEGWIEIRDGAKQYIPRGLEIEVRDIE